jgi:predicted DNA-binding protein
VLSPKDKKWTVTSYLGIHVRLEVREKLEALAREQEVPLSTICRWAIREYLEKHNGIR